MEYLDKLFKRSKEKKEKVLVVYDNDNIKHEVNEWVKYLERESFSDILLEIGFKEGDTIYLYSKGLNYYEFHYSVNEDKINTADTIKLSYGAFNNRGVKITIENENKMISYAIGNDNKFEVYLEKEYVSDVIEYTRHYFSHSSMMWLNSQVGDKDYILRLSVFRTFDNDEVFRLDNEIELEKYLCSLELPCDLLVVFKRICEICRMDLTNYDSFDLELHRKNKRFSNESDVISFIKFLHGEFSSLSYIKDNKKVFLNSSGDWSYEMIDEDDLVKLSINVKDNKISCNVNSNNNIDEIDDYFKYFALYDINNARCEIDSAKKLVKSLFNR